MTDQRFSLSERTADGVVHGLGLVFAAAALAVLAVLAGPASPGLQGALGIYGAGLALMLGCSALYNLTRDPRRRRLFRRFDHAAIFAMIAGTYTPFVALALGGETGRRLLLIVWLAAAAGIVFKLFWTGRFDRLAVVFYLAVGWAGLLAIRALVATLTPAGLALLGGGGALYSIGVAFHLWRRLPFQNAIWHALVLGGAACHFAAILIEIGAAARRGSLAAL